jgi:hypothetical protein
MLGDIVRAIPDDTRSGRKPFSHPFDDLVGLCIARSSSKAASGLE